MTTTDWIIDIALVLIVVRQLREERLTVRFVVLPAAIVAYVAHTYVHGFATTGNNVELVVVSVVVGALLGALGGALTRVRTEGGTAYIRAGWSAAALWVVSMTARLLFIVWITHPSGAQALGRFSVDHHISGAGVWQTALVLLALSEVIARIGIIVLRGVIATSRSAADRELVTAA